MRIAILGATSQIAKDLIVIFSAHREFELHLFARRTVDVINWLDSIGISQYYPVNDFSVFKNGVYEVIINFVGTSDPQQVLMLGKGILEVTSYFDELVMDYLSMNPSCRYLFLSSGAAYGSDFINPATNTSSIEKINVLTKQDWYALAKQQAEIRHRLRADLSIFDIRLFSYFSNNQSTLGGLFMSCILRSIINRDVLKVLSCNLVRDYLNPVDFFSFINAIIEVQPQNVAVDCFSCAPVAKFDLLSYMKNEFGLTYKVNEPILMTDTYNCKPRYYSLNKFAEDLGYRPSLTSLEGISLETRKILKIE